MRDDEMNQQGNAALKSACADRWVRVDRRHNHVWTRWRPAAQCQQGRWRHGTPVTNRHPTSPATVPPCFEVKLHLLRGHRLVAIFPGGGSAFCVGLRLRKSPRCGHHGEILLPSTIRSPSVTDCTTAPGSPPSANYRQIVLFSSNNHWIFLLEFWFSVSFATRNRVIATKACKSVAQCVCVRVRECMWVCECVIRARRRAETTALVVARPFIGQRKRLLPSPKFKVQTKCRWWVNSNRQLSRWPPLNTNRWTAAAVRRWRHRIMRRRRRAEAAD